MRILVVDDEEHLRHMMRLTLEASGFDVAVAADGEAALTLFGDGAGFDVTLLDQRMPGMDGLETLRRLKQRRGDAPIIMVTAYASIELAVDAMKLGATDFVRKPLTPDTLRHAVAAALEKRAVVPAVPAAAAAPPSPAVASPVAPAARSPREVWTTNGFFLRRADSAQPTDGSSGTEHHFIVRRGGEQSGRDVVVAIDPKAVERVARESRRPLRPEGAFWREHTEKALLDYLWSEAAIPDGGRLTISRVPGGTINSAMNWTRD